MTKCSVSRASQEDLQSLAQLKVACTRENYRGFFEFAPLNEQDPSKASEFFEEMLAAPDTYLTVLKSETAPLGYAVSRWTENPAGGYACELLAIDVLPEVSSADYHMLIIAAVEAAAEKGITIAFVYLLNNNFRARFAFEHVGFRRDGNVTKAFIGGERFDLLRYVHCFSSPCLL